MSAAARTTTPVASRTSLAPAVPDSAATAAHFVGTALPLAGGLLAYHLTVRFSLSELVGGAWDWWTIILLRTQTTAVAVTACLAWADRGAAGNVHVRLRYFAAVVAGNVVAGVVASGVLHWTDLPFGGPTALQWVLYIQLEYLLLTAGAAFASLDRRRARVAQVRLQAAQRRRLDAARGALATRLRATQARIEPRFLFETLADVRQLHGQDRPRAERLLDALIAYLRAAMPRSRDTAPTVRQEIDLVRAWLLVVGSGPQGAIDACIAVAPEALEARVPPMLLLPLARCLLDARARSTHAPRDLRLAIAVAGPRLEVRAACSAWVGHTGADDSLASLRERVAALYGTEARLVLAAGLQGGLEAVLDIPFEAEAADPPTAATGRSASSVPASTGSSRAAAAPTRAQIASARTAGTSRT